ncbi:MAG: PEP-CTERM sorting domain-containing protein [Phycisphaeraceae bacterium]|nr:PEP-CTERM sorting domain-containing protein [Phycisphaeraceae bacterium]
MKTTVTRIVMAAACVVGFQSQPLSAALTLFPGTASEVVDGGPGDASGAVNGMIVIDPGAPLAVPGMPGIEFAGMVEYLPAGATTTFGQVVGLRGVRVTGAPAGSGLPGAGQPATLTNTTGSTVSFGNPLIWVEYTYPTLDPAGNPGIGDIFIHLQADLDTTPLGGGTINNVNQRIEIDFRVSSFWIDTLGAPYEPVTANWFNTVSPSGTGPIGVGGFELLPGDYNIDFGRMHLSLNALTLGPGERYEFPASIVAGAVPEPASLALLALGGSVLLLRRRAA